ncbi:hypothetical protein NTE_02232 [Candidatus Nitrososphaera evergladensis SR1]|uniref:YVTN family beta-propeller repeat protein n=1 Tax=Candidatus Nitrososphaera evergladensis SR1 TaxID=1459636 RepID=A0A075MRZ9_9ARCH|nr:YncE family protein [Candidatus Nitrososphaera evergladensis]AIF84286.1 hypothetical protein NTE_02232 [Candidatus Nitrososphaera evergladensis SR1]
MRVALATVFGILLFALLSGVRPSFGQQQDDDQNFANISAERVISLGHTFSALDIGIDLSGQILFLTDRSNRTLVLYDLENNVTKSIDVEHYTSMVAVDSATKKAYVTNGCDCPAAHDVTVIDYSKGVGSAKVEATITNVSKRASPIAINDDTGKIYVGSSSNALTVIDGTTNKVVGTIGEGRINVSGIDINPKTNQVYVIDNSTTLYKIDGATNKILGNIMIGLPSSAPKEGGNEGDSSKGRLIPTAIAVNPNTNVVYVINQKVPKPIPLGEEAPLFNTAYLVAVNGTSNTIINPNIATLNSIDFDIAVNNDTNTVYVLGLRNTGLIKVDGTTNSVSLEQDFSDLKDSFRHVVVDESTNKFYLSGRTGIFEVSENNNKANAPEFRDFVMLIPALAIAAAVITTRLLREF